MESWLGVRRDSANESSWLRLLNTPRHLPSARQSSTHSDSPRIGPDGDPKPSFTRAGRATQESEGSARPSRPRNMFRFASWHGPSHIPRLVPDHCTSIDVLAVEPDR